MAPGAIQNFVSALQKLNKVNDVYDHVEKHLDLLRKNPSSLPPLLTQFDMETYSPVHTAVLFLMYEPAFSDKSNLVSLTTEFLKKINVNRRLGPWLHLITAGFVDRLILLKQPIKGIPILIEFIKRVQISPEQLTGFHSDLLQLALASQCFAPVMRFLNQDILDISKNRTVDPKDYLQFFYYLGMIQAALKQFEKSLQSFDNCLLMPAMVPSKIIIEAAKKQILVSLIVHGRHVKGHFGGQTSTSSHAESMIKRYITVYSELINVFKKDDVQYLDQYIVTHQQVFVGDKNFGLVKQVREAYIKSKIKNLTKTFITMGLSDLAERVGLNSARLAEKYLVEMMDAKEIAAKISQEDETVQFMDDQEQYESAEMLVQINAKIAECVSLEKYLNVISDQVVTSAAYTKWSCENESRSANKNTL